MMCFAEGIDVVDFERRSHGPVQQETRWRLSSPLPGERFPERREKPINVAPSLLEFLDRFNSEGVTGWSSPTASRALTYSLTVFPVE